MGFQETVKEIIARDNVINYYHIEKKRGKEVPVPQFSKTTEAKLEKEFDTWFMNLAEEEQKAYLFDITNLETDFNLRVANLTKGTKAELVNLHHPVFEEIRKEVTNQLYEVENMIERTNMEENKTQEANTLLERLDGLYANLKARDDYCWKQISNQGGAEVNEQRRPSTEVVTISAKKEWYYFPEMSRSNTFFSVISSKKVDENSVEITYQPYTDTAAITKIVPSHTLKTFKYGALVDEYVYPEFGENPSLLERQKVYLQDRKLSHEEFEKYFSPTEPIQQSDEIGDCYLIAGLNGYRQLTHRETIIAQNIKFKYNKKGNIKKVQVGLPLGTKQYTKVLHIDGNCLNHPKLLKGPLGYKALEVAYLMLRAEALGKETHIGRLNKELDTELLTGGMFAEVAQDFFGKNIEKPILRDLSDDSAEFYRKAMGFGLSTFSNYNTVATVSSHGSKRTSLTDKNGKKVDLHPNHAFTLVHVEWSGDVKDAYALLENPRNPKEKIELYLTDFVTFFDTIQFMRLDYNNMFK